MFARHARLDTHYTKARVAESCAACPLCHASVGLPARSSLRSAIIHGSTDSPKSSTDVGQVDGQHAFTSNDCWTFTILGTPLLLSLDARICRHIILRRCQEVRIGNMLHDLIINQILNLLSSHPVHVFARLHNCPPVPSLTCSNAAFMLNGSLGAYWIPCAYLGVTLLALRAPEKICSS